MARLQDFQSVTPATSDNLLIVQSQGQGLATLNAAGQKVATETTMSSLTTTAKTLVGAISENADYIKYLLRTEQTDLNSSLNGGTVSPRITYYASTASNRPSGNSGVVITQGNGTYRQQTAIDLEGNIFARYYNNGTISSWVNRVDAVSSRVDKLEKTTVSATKGSSMPSGFPSTPSAITRCGAMVTVQFGQQIPAGTYTAQQTLWTMNPTPRNIARAVVQTGAYYNIINILGTGEIRFNGTLTFDSPAWLIGQLIYITALS